MVDHLSYFQYGPPVARNGPLDPSRNDEISIYSNYQRNDGLNTRYRTHFDNGKVQKKTWENDQYMLFPPRVLGHILRDKQWAQLQVTLMEDIPSDDPRNA